MNKQVFQIPDGCKAVTVEQVGNQIITTFEPEKPELKRGDVIYCEDKNGYNWIFILKEKINRDINPYTYFCATISIGGIIMSDCCRHPERTFRHATPEEAQRLWDALAKEGKRWNPETMEVEEIKKEIPRAKKGDTYWSFDYSDLRVFSTEETGHIIDKTRHKQCRYFLSEEQSRRAAEKIQQSLVDFWEEELK